MAASTNETAPTKVEVKKEDCIFCKIGRKEMPDQEFIYYDNEVFVIPDLKPHAPTHFLVIPHNHHENPKVLKKDDVDLVKKLRELGFRIIKEKHPDAADAEIRMGYHWPPLVSINHLHMHVLYPISQMSFFGRNGIFKPGFLFVTPEWLIERLERLERDKNE